MGQSGTILDSSSISKYLEDANKDVTGQRTWAKAYSSLDLSRQLATNSLQKEYGSSINDAYVNTSKNNAAISASNLGIGYKTQAINDNDVALNDAYNSYLQNFISNKSTINDSIAESVYDVNALKDTQADNTLKYANSHFDYLQNMWDKYESGELSTDLFNEPSWSKYTNMSYDALGNITTDENGNPIRSLKDISEIRSEMFDDEQYLTVKGIDFFDQMENDTSTRGIYSFGDYLADNDVDTYNWATSYNPYDYAPDKVGNSTNASSFNTMVGMMSDDAEYTFAERAFAMNEGELNTMFNDIMNKAEESAAKYSGDVDESILTDFSTEMNAVMEDLGISTDDVDMTGSETKILEAIQDYQAKVTELSEEEAYYKKLAFLEGGDNAATRNMLSNTTDADKISTLQADVDFAKANIKSTYTNAVTQVLNYSQNIRRQSEIDFYGKEMKAGGTISTSNNRISKYDDHYNYNMPNGKTATLITAVSLKDDGSNIRDTKGDNFNVTYNGEKYKLEVNKDEDLVITTAEQTELNNLVMTAKKRGLTMGDIFYYNNRLWTVSDDNTVKAIQNRSSFTKGYEKLLAQLKADSIID